MINSKLKPQFSFTNVDNNWTEKSIGPRLESASALPFGIKVNDQIICWRIIVDKFKLTPTSLFGDSPLKALFFVSRDSNGSTRITTGPRMAVVVEANDDEQPPRRLPNSNRISLRLFSSRSCCSIVFPSHTPTRTSTPPALLPPPGGLVCIHVSLSGLLL